MKYKDLTSFIPKFDADHRIDTIDHRIVYEKSNVAIRL